MSRVAMIGLGQMGGPMADNLLRAGHEVRVFDIAPAAVEARVALGAVGCASPADAADGCAVVGIVVFDDAQLEAVVLGDDGVLSVLAPGSVIAVHTTATLDTIRRLAHIAEETGVHVVDAGISGGETGAVAGTLMLMVGGSADAVDTVRPVLDAFAKEVVHAGPLGAGMALKLARNATGYALMAAVHEAMSVAALAGVELRALEHVLRETALFDQGMSPFLFGGPDPLPAGDSPMRPMMEHLARLGDKDLEHAQELAGDLGVAIPVVDATRAEFGAVSRLGR